MKRDEAFVARQKIAETALKFGDEAFHNALEHMAMLNQGVILRTRGANINWNALSGVLVEYNLDHSKHEVRPIPPRTTFSRFGSFPPFDFCVL